MNYFSITYNGLTIDSNQTTYILNEADGLNGLGIRVSEAVTPVFDGGNVYKRLYDMRTIGFNGVIITEIPEDYFSAKQALVDAFSRFGDTLLTITRWDGVTKAINAKVVSAPMIVEKGGRPTTGSFRVELRCENPYFISASETDVTIFLSSGAGTPIPIPIPAPIGLGSSNQTFLVNAGDAEGYAEFVINGYVNSPTVTNVTTGEYFQIATEIPSGSFVRVRFDQQGVYVMLNDNTSYYQYLSGDIFPLVAGSNLIRFTASGYSSEAELNVSYNSYYTAL